MNELEGHTIKRFDGEISNLHMRILEMGGLVIEQLKTAVKKGICEKDLDAAHQVVASDRRIDDLEMTIDEEVIAILTRRNPVAKDLRVVMSVSKLVTDLERAGDETVKIANMAIHLYDNDNAAPNKDLLRDIYTMGKLVINMLESSLKIFDILDIEEAKNIAYSHSGLDDEFQSSLRRLYTFVMEDSRNVGYATKIVLIIKALERIGELSRSVIAYVIYLIEGTDVRHHINSPALKPA